MATDSKISALPANPGVTPTDVVEVIDVSNTSNQATGENTRSTVAGLITGLPAVLGAGTGHAAGLVPDPGATSHSSAPYLLGDDGTFHQLTGPAVTYAGGAYTITGGGGGAWPGPGGSPGDIQTNNGSGGLGGLAIVPVARGGTGLTAMGTALQVLRVNAGATGLEFATGSGGGTPGGSSGDLQVNSSGAFGAIAGNVRGGLAAAGAAGFALLAPGTLDYGIASGGSGADLVWKPVVRPLYIQTAKVTGSVNGANLLMDSTGAIGSRAIPAGFFSAGRGIRITGGGYWVTSDTGAANCFPYIQIGPSGTIVVATGVAIAMQTPVATYGFKFTIELVCKTAGASGTLDASGQFVTSAAGTFYLMNGTTAGTQSPATPSPIDTTGVNVINLYVNIGSATKPITLVNLIIEDIRN